MSLTVSSSGATGNLGGKKTRGLAGLSLAIGAIGVVYGDIGTSPLYAVSEIFFGKHGFATDPGAVLGSISLVVWALTLVIAVKYLGFVLEADSDGEGGVFAFYSRIHKEPRRFVPALKALLTLAAGLLLGESIITPAISVLSALEGAVLFAPSFEAGIIPLTLAILLALFAMQQRGTHRMGRVFAPVAILWFVAIGLAGLSEIARAPVILEALNPWLAVRFLDSLSLRQAFVLLGSVMLVITGGEAVFGDLGHFGKRAIRLSWFALVYPALMLNYLGQGAHLLAGEAVPGGNLFYSMIPHALVLPMVVLATCATVVASQALISGSFSLVSQAIGVGLFPRLQTVHTHEDHAGQIYVPAVNWALFAGSVTLVLTLRTSTNLAAAYGLAMLTVMFSTSLSMLAISRLDWKWPRWKSLAVFGSFAAIDAAFLAAKSLKFLEGGFIPLTIGLTLFTVMRIWRWGRKKTAEAYSGVQTMKLGELARLHRESEVLINRNIVFMVPRPMTSLEDNIPALVQFYLNRYEWLPRNLFLVEVIHRKMPYIRGQRHLSRVFSTREDGGKIVSVTIEFGFMEDPDVEKVLEDLAHHHEIELPSDPHKWLIHVSHEYLIPPRNRDLFSRLRFRTFLLLRQITRPGYFHYGLGKDLNLSVDIMPVKIS